MIDIDYIILKEMGEGVEYNPACFAFREKEAREKKLWRSEEKMPTITQLKNLWSKKYKAMIEAERVKKKETADFKTKLKELLEGEEWDDEKSKSTIQIVSDKFLKEEEK